MAIEACFIHFSKELDVAGFSNICDLLICIQSHIFTYVQHLNTVVYQSVHTLCIFCLFDLILNVPSTIFQLCRDRSSWVEPVLS